METHTHTHTYTHRHTDTQNDYRNPRCACAPRVNYCKLCPVRTGWGRLAGTPSWSRANTPPPRLGFPHHTQNKFCACACKNGTRVNRGEGLGVLARRNKNVTKKNKNVRASIHGTYVYKRLFMRIWMERS